MRELVYARWPWLAVPATAWFAVEAALHVAFGDHGAALRAAALGVLAASSVAAARYRRLALAPIA